MHQGGRSLLVAHLAQGLDQAMGKNYWKWSVCRPRSPEGKDTLRQAWLNTALQKVWGALFDAALPKAARSYGININFLDKPEHVLVVIGLSDAGGLYHCQNSAPFCNKAVLCSLAARLLHDVTARPASNITQKTLR